MSDADLAASKGTIINEMFVYTADENYVVARWAHENRLYTDFFWNSVHALEKYMKAVLLFNGIPVNKFSHGLVKLYAEIEKVAGALLPTVLARPAELDIFHWVDLTPVDFLAKLDQNGNADNRYLTYGYSQQTWYIHMVDMVVWSVRRLALPLDQPNHPLQDLPHTLTYCELLTRHPNYVPRLSQALEKLVDGQECSARNALLNNNCAFAPDDFTHVAQRVGATARNPVLLRRVLDPLSSDCLRNVRQAYQIGGWLLASTKQSKPVRDQIDAAMKAAEAAHPALLARTP